MSAAVRAGGRNQPSIQSERFHLKIRKNFAFLGIAHHYSMLPRQVAESPSWEISRNEVNIQSSQVPFFPAFYDPGRDLSIKLLLGQGFHSTDINMLEPPQIHWVSKGHRLGSVIKGSVMTPRFRLCRERFENWCYRKPNKKRNKQMKD